jgi:hypothetical protein
LAAALQRVESNEKWSIASSLLQHSEDKNDHNLPKMIWYGIEPLMTENKEKFLEMALNQKSPY